MRRIHLNVAKLQAYGLSGKADACAIERTDTMTILDADSECAAEIVAIYRTGKPAKSKGLGDTVSKITAALGIKECGGCARRKALLNKLVPYSAI